MGNDELKDMMSLELSSKAARVKPTEKLEIALANIITRIDVFLDSGLSSNRDRMKLVCTKDVNGVYHRTVDTKTTPIPNYSKSKPILTFKGKDIYFKVTGRANTAEADDSNINLVYYANPNITKQVVAKLSEGFTKTLIASENDLRKRDTSVYLTTTTAADNVPV
jgi:hypothetical protein